MAFFWSSMAPKEERWTLDFSLVVLAYFLNIVLYNLSLSFTHTKYYYCSSSVSWLISKSLMVLSGG